MAGSVNKVIIVGRLGRDPEVRSFQNGGKVCNLSVATDESWKDKATGERKSKTEWHKVSIFNDRLADVAGKYLAKGSQVYIEGQIETRKYTDKDGADKYSTEIVLKAFKGELTILEGKDRVETQSESSATAAQAQAQAKSAQIDDDIPW